jgi:hypothetical protein
VVARLRIWDVVWSPTPKREGGRWLRRMACAVEDGLWAMLRRRPWVAVADGLDYA